VSYDPCALLADLVRIPSPSGSEAQVRDHLWNFFQEHGLDVERVGDSLLVTIERGPGPTLLLTSHMDTVPAGPSWTADPYAGVWQDGRLVGLGANDAGAAVVGMIGGTLAFAEVGGGTGTLQLALTACEETTNKGMEDILAHTGLPDGAITGEPTGLSVVRAQAGLAVLLADWEGSSCHAAHAARVEHTNALLVATNDLAGFPQCVTLEGEHPLLGASTITCTQLNAGDRHNRVPDAAQAVFDCRLAPPHTASECVALLEERLPRAKVTIRSERLRPVETGVEHPFVHACLKAASADQSIGSATMSDMALLADIPAVKCGPGETARSHVPDEFCLRSEVEAGCAFYIRAIHSCLDSLQLEGATS
jgi:acetylornithine deacetylase